MKNNKITLVTAFFPINRGKWQNFERSDDKYLRYFEFWARIQNDLIVYTTPEFKDRILKIRQNFNHNNTKIITISNPFTIDPTLYRSIQQVAESKIAQDFRLQPRNPESWNADYNYIMVMKEWCLNDIAKQSPNIGMLAWIDFGFNHGGAYYSNPDDFDFEWSYAFSDKIHFFKIHDDDNLPIFEIIRRMNTYIQGDLFVVPASSCQKLWEETRKNMLAINQSGLMDDDQTLLTMFSRQHPELCELHQSSWFSQIAQCSDHTFQIVPTDAKNTIQAKQENLYHRKLVKQYVQKWRRILNSSKIKG